MKLLLVLGNTKGGHEQRNIEFGKHMEKLGWYVVAAVYEKDPHLPFDQLMYKKILRTKKLTGFENLLLSFRIKKNVLNQFDVVYGKAWNKTMALKVMRVVGDQDRAYQASWIARKLYKVLNWFDKKLYLKAHAIIACSPQAKSFAERIGCEFILQSSNFVDTEYFYEEKHRRSGFLFVGRDDPIKNFKAIKHLHPRVVGMFSWLDKDDMRTIYSSSTAVVIPSFYESFCTVVLEALACGCPVIASKGVTAAQVLKDYVTITEDFDMPVWEVDKTLQGQLFVIRNLNKEVVLKKESDFILSYF